MRSNARAHSWKAKVCFCEGKARQPVDGTNGSKLKLQFACNFAFSLRTFAENHLPSSILGFPLLIQSLTRFSSSSLFPLNFNLIPCTSTTSSTGQQCILLVLFQIWNVVFVGENRKRWKQLNRSPFTHSPYNHYRIGVCLSDSRQGSKISWRH